MTRQLLTPFGLEIQSDTPGTSLTKLPADELLAELARHRVLVCRGFVPPTDKLLLDYCRGLGEILEWEFGAFNELRVAADAKNYLYTNRAVPFHWDGAFVGRPPHVILFVCIQAPPAGDGGETLFCDTTRLLASLDDEERRLFERLEITYSTEKVAHYGGRFTSPMMGRHALSGEAVLRYAEPVDDLNPVRLEIDGVPAGEREAFLGRMHKLLRDERWLLAHAWRDGDIVLADNHALLHGRRALSSAAPRHLRRVNIV